MAEPSDPRAARREDPGKLPPTRPGSIYHRSMRLLRACACLVIAACGGEIGGGGTPDGATASADAYQLCVDKTNQLRATVGKPAVARSVALEAYANTSASYDFANPSPPHAHFQMT